jgi:hypothetical protein
MGSSPPARDYELQDFSLSPYDIVIFTHRPATTASRRTLSQPLTVRRFRKRRSLTYN